MTARQIITVKSVIISLLQRPILIKIDEIKDAANRQLEEHEQLTREKTARIIAYLIEHSKKES